MPLPEALPEFPQSGREVVSKNLDARLSPDALSKMPADAPLPVDASEWNAAMQTYRTHIDDVDTSLIGDAKRVRRETAGETEVLDHQYVDEPKMNALLSDMDTNNS